MASVDEFADDKEVANWSGVLSVRTLGGTEYVLKNLTPDTTTMEVRVQLGKLLGAPPFTLHLLAGPKELAPEQTLSEAGLAVEGASVAVMRRAVDQATLRSLFEDLLRAIARRNAAEARRLVDQGAGFDTEGRLLREGDGHMYHLHRKDSGCTMLNLAIRERLDCLALHVIAKGADVEAAGFGNRRPLIQAVLKGFDGIAEVLLDAGADATVRDYTGNSALEYALRRHSDKISGRLLSALPLEDQERAFVGMAPCLEGLETEGFLRRPGVGGSWPPLLVCCASTMPQAATALLRAKAAVNGRDEQGRTALHYAFARGLPELAAELVACGADEVARDDAGWLPQDGVRPHPEAEVAPGAKPRRCLLASILF